MTLVALLIAAAVVLSLNLRVGKSHAASSCTASAACAGAVKQGPNFLTHACALLTNTAAARAVGAKLENRISQPHNELNACEWDFAAFSKYTAAAPTLQLMVGKATEAAFIRNMHPQHGLLVKGVGQIAFYEANPVPFLIVWDHGYVLTLFAPLVESPLAAERAVANHALQRLHARR